MHRVVIPDEITERVIRHRGRAAVYDRFNPRRAALLVIDMQNAFMPPGVAHALCPTAVEIVPNINRLATVMRRTGGSVVWVISTFGAASTSRCVRFTCLSAIFYRPTTSSRISIGSALAAIPRHWSTINTFAAMKEPWHEFHH